MEGINANTVQNYSEKFIDMAIRYGPKLLLTIVVLIVGLWIVKLLVKATNKAMERFRNRSFSLENF